MPKYPARVNNPAAVRIERATTDSAIPLVAAPKSSFVCETAAKAYLLAPATSTRSKTSPDTTVDASK
jgi:hypothetical protein